MFVFLVQYMRRREEEWRREGRKEGGPKVKEREIGPVSLSFT